MIDHERLMNALKDMLLEDQWGNYDLKGIVRNASLCWDDTAIKVTCPDFTFIFDKISYECKSVSTKDLTENIK